MSNYNKLELGDNTITLKKDVLKSEDYFFRCNFISVSFVTKPKYPISISLKSITGSGEGHAIHDKLVDLNVKDYGILNFEYKQLDNDFDLIVTLK